MTASIALGVLFYLNWRLTSVTILILAVFGGMMAFAFARLRPIFRDRGQINAEVTGRLGESLGGIRVVKSYVAERGERLVFARGVHRLFRNIARTITATSGLGAGTILITGAIGVLMIMVGGHAILDGRMTLGGFVMYVFFIGLVAAPLVQHRVHRHPGERGVRGPGPDPGVCAARSRKTRTTRTGSRIGDGLRGEIAFEQVEFAYDPGVPVLKGVSFHAPAGSTTALVGSSGSGKSTLISLVMAFARPAAGRVLVDGQDLGALRLHDYRAHLGVVLQDNFLFDGTIAENIGFAKPHATREEILRVAGIAHCDEFVAKFKDGYDTVVGERGVKLSGGQRQRVAIARAILADPRILILDEATSSLDSESEAMIQDGLRKLRQGRTTFVIAHRLSTIRSADQILVLEGGEIVERGTHRELFAAQGRYRQLHDRQYALETNRFINPGEDFTPEPEPAVPAPAAPARPGAL